MLAGWLVAGSVGYLAAPVLAVGWLVGWLVGLLVGWLVGRLVGWLCASPCTPEHVLAERKPHVCNAFSELRCVPLLAVLECGASRAVAG